MISLGRFIERFPEVRVLRYPAIAEVKENFARSARRCFLRFKPLDLLLERKKTQTSGIVGIGVSAAPDHRGRRHFANREAESGADVGSQPDHEIRALRRQGRHGRRRRGVHRCGADARDEERDLRDRARRPRSLGRAGA